LLKWPEISRYFWLFVNIFCFWLGEFALGFVEHNIRGRTVPVVSDVVSRARGAPLRGHLARGSKGAGRGGHCVEGWGLVGATPQQNGGPFRATVREDLAPTNPHPSN